MLTIKDIEIKLENITKGGDCLLTKIAPVYEYGKDGTRIDNILGYKYFVVAPKNGYKEFGVKVLGKAAMATQEMIDNADEPIAVEFKDFKARFYRTPRGDYQLTAEASDAIIVRINF